MGAPVSLVVTQRAYIAWLYFFLILFTAGSAFTTASNQQNLPSISGESLRMPSGGGAVKRGENGTVSTTRSVFATAPPITQQQAHATDVEIAEVEAAGEKVGYC